MDLHLRINEISKEPYISVRFEHGETTLEADVIQMLQKHLKTHDLEMTNLGGSRSYTSFYLTLKPKK